MGKAFRKLFNLYAGEGRKAGLFAILAFLWGLGSYGGFTLSEGLFIEHVGAEALPLTYFIIALSMCAFSSILLLSLSRLSVYKLLYSMIFAAILCDGVFYFLLTSTSLSEQIGFWYAFKVMGWMIPIAIYICFWAFVDQYYDLQDAKRFFCLFNSAIFLGDACGGGAIALGLHFGEAAPILLFFICTMGASLPFISLIRTRIPPVQEEAFEECQGRNGFSFKQIGKSVLNSRFTLLLMLFYLVMQLLAIVTEYNYMETFEKVFSSSSKEHGLTEFLGSCGMWISLANVFFGLIIYSRLVQKMGVNNIILIAPLCFLMLFVVWMWKEALPLAVFGLIGREGLVYTFDDNNLNLLVAGVPTKVKNHVRIAVESFFEPVGLFLSAALLLALQHQSRSLGLVLAVIALFIVLFLRSSYPRAIFRNLVASSIRFEKKATDWIATFSKRERKNAEFLLLVNLKKSDEKMQLLAIEYLLKIGNPRVLPRLLNHFGRLSIPGKVKVIELLSESSFAKRGAVLERLEQWRRTLPHPALKSAIHFYFAKHALADPEHILKDLHSEHLGLRGAAILSLKTAEGSPSCLSLANTKLQKLLQASEEQEICMGLRILGLEGNPQNIEHLFPFLKHPSVRVNRTAAQSLANVADPAWKGYAHQLVYRLPLMRDQLVRLSILEALQKLKNPQTVQKLICASVHFRPNERKMVEKMILDIGKSAIPILLDILHDSSVHVRCRLLSGKILGGLSPVDLRSDLYTIIHKEIERAYFYFYHAHTIQEQVPEHDLSILQDALLTSYQCIIDFLVQVLGIASSIEECEVLSHSLHSKNRKIRAHAIETLEKTTDPKIFSLLEPLIDERPPEVSLRHYLRNGRIPYNLTQLLDALLHSPFLSDQIVSISLKSKLNTPDWRGALREKLESEEEIFHHFAHELLAK